MFQHNINTSSRQLIYSFPLSPLQVEARQGFSNLPEQPILESTNYPFDLQYPWGVQLAKNNKIYVANLIQTPTIPNISYLSAVNSPNVFGAGCNFNPNAILLVPGVIQNGFLPQLVNKDKRNLNCSNTLTLPNTCSNYFANSNFSMESGYSQSNTSATGPYNYPFNLNVVPSWKQSHGSPQLDDEWTFSHTGVHRVSPVANYGYSSMEFFKNANGIYSEGIVQKIPNLVATQKYVFSFYKSVTQHFTNTSVHKFKVVLLNCNDIANFPVESLINNQPTIPSSAQVIYCETNPTNSNWERNFVSFTANSNYNMIWVYPSVEGSSTTEGTINFAYPELININNFSAGVSVPSANCMVTIGPTTPNCSLSGAQFNWKSPTGVIIPATASQQMQVDASIPTNVSTWTLQMSVPNVVATNNTCSINGGIQASVIVSNCSTNPSGPAVITTSSYFKYGGCSPITPPNTPIIPNTTTQVCAYWECSGWAYLYSNYPDHNDWYVDDILVPNFHGQILNTNDGYIPVAIRHHGLNKYQVKNSFYSGLQQISQPTYLNFSVYFGPVGPEWLGFYKPNYVYDVSIQNFFAGNPNVTFVWNIPGCTVTNLTTNGGSVRIYFPSTLPTTGVTGSVTVSNSNCLNGSVILINFTYNQQLKEIKFAKL